ncbi:WXG100 family type VII secretion target [Streptomyces sp. B3I8]|uniref:WXG100 family type VII secretion target n=1 Tax=Streptomyces sp. B3I8 TaxID=3042303 RepID=UPI00278AAE98|nr:WXG100 family type VII secretion target [Streptomyces sp. B3I8]MDQ0786696.1 WXG100 family type VII secretion target [Streptomyces sp. B3I8]
MTTPTGHATVGGVEYNVTLVELNQASLDTDATSTRLEEQLAELKSFVVSLEGVWNGYAANEFQALMAQWDVYAAMLREALTGIASGLRGNYENYSTTESVNHATLASIHAGIPSANFS